MMTPFPDAEVFFPQDLAQFEPDPDGEGCCETPSLGVADADALDPQWVVWDDPLSESEWAAVELGF